MLLQKKDNEGFGFVLRGAKGEPPLPTFLIFSVPMDFSVAYVLSYPSIVIFTPSVSTHCLCSCPLQLRLP